MGFIKGGIIMKKTIIIELTEKEKNFIKTCPPNPCVDCITGGGCIGGCCKRARDFRKRTEFMEKEVVDLAQEYQRAKALGKRMDEIKKEQEELLQRLRDCGVEV